MIDDWGGKTLGADEPVNKPLAKKKSSTTGLLVYFRDATISKNMTLNAPVNGMALMKVFKNLQEKA